MTKIDVSRRSFLKGAVLGAVGAGVAGTGLVGCAAESGGSDSASTGESSTSTGSAGSTAGMTPQQAMAELNPQNYDYTNNSIVDWTSTTLFTEWSLGNLTMSNRMVKSAAGSAYLPWWTTEMTISEYTHFAKGGVELMWMEDYGNTLLDYPAFYKGLNRDTMNLKEIVDAIHESGSYCGYQLSLMGASFSGFDASTAPEFASAQADDMTLDELHGVQANFIDAAKWLQEQGIDAIEINAAGNNIGQAFLSRNRNERDDDYGPQSFENRTRFVREIVEGIKEICGADYPVQVLINAVEENDVNLGQNETLTTVEENVEMAKLFEESGVDSLHVRLGPFGYHPAEFASDMYFTGYGINGVTGYGNQFDFGRHFQGKLNAENSGCGMLLDVAAEIKSAVSIPVGTVTYMDPAHAPDLFENALKDGKVDFLLMNRPFMVDPEYINKLKEGRIEEIRPCNRCLHCHFDLDEEGNFYEHCRMNATHMRAYTEQMPEGPDIPTGEGKKKIMVIGGGPAGMEAARVAAIRGYDVSLYEKKSEVGGLMPFANAVKGPHENILLAKDYFVHQMEINGVNVVTSTEVDAALVEAEAPDVVIVATGGLRKSSELESSSDTEVVSIDDFMTADIGDNVTVLGGALQAVDTTLYLLAQGKKVTIVSPAPVEKLDMGQSDHIKDMVIPMLYTRGVRVWPNAAINTVGDGEITITCDTGVDMTFACDTVIEAFDMLPNTELPDALSGMEVYAVGDCNKPFNIAEAIAAGNLTARNI